jgi:hypothetical protein
VINYVNKKAGGIGTTVHFRPTNSPEGSTVPRLASAGCVDVDDDDDDDDDDDVDDDDDDVLRCYSCGVL